MKITVSGKLGMNHQPISDDILLHYGTTAVYNQSTRDCKNPIEHLWQLYLMTPTFDNNVGKTIVSPRVHTHTHKISTTCKVGP